jgi:uncharacterized membrane protein YbhN (UPF0104 family)
MLAGTLVGAGVLAAVYAGGARGMLRFALEVRLRSWLALTALTLAFYSLDYVRFWSLLAVLGHRLRYLVGLQLACVSYFVTNLTPNAELHTPAMIFLLHQDGVPVAEAAAASLVKSIYMMLWICVFAFASLQLDGGAILPAGTARVASLGVLGQVAVLGSLVIFPTRIQAFAARRSARLAAPWARKLVEGGARVAASIARLGRSRDLLHFTAHAASITFVLLYVVIGRTSCAALGIALSWHEALTVFPASLFVAYFAPVPGSIGVTELATAYLIDRTISPRAVAAATLLRCCCWYSATLPGAAILLLRTWRARRAAAP